MSSIAASNSTAVQRVAVTPGDPAGIGPDIVVALLQQELACEPLVVCDPRILAERAQTLGMPLEIELITATTEVEPHCPGRARVLSVDCPANIRTGQPDSQYVGYLLESLNLAVELCLNHQCHAMVTGPLSKALINDAGIAFTGHTEYLATRCDVERPVMLLANGTFRVALVTTHVPLARVPQMITAQAIRETCTIVAQDLCLRFGIEEPRIAVCGLNPHAGESGHLGLEEQQVIAPEIEALQRSGLNIAGPLPADTAFTAKNRPLYDAYVAMFHDQGLAALKAVGFGDTANITLGLPIIRTSVDHGTAFALAGSGNADTSSLSAALNVSLQMRHAAANAQ